MPDTFCFEPLSRAATLSPPSRDQEAAPALLRRATLRVVAGPDLGRTFDLGLGLGPALRGGRDPACDIVLRDPALREVHFELAPERGRLVVRDLEGGVWVGELRLREAWLAPDAPDAAASFRVGGTTLALAGLERAELPLAPFCHLGDLDGQSDAMRVLFYRLVELAARCERPHVLLSGEAGTGKSLAARSLHLLSPDRDAPFVTLDARTLPSGQVERELLGAGQRPGALGSAGGGTLLLRGVDELPLAVQHRLAARLAAPAAGPRPRLVATTRRDLQRLCAAGSFSRELRELLRGQHLVLPPLRERGRDLAFLAERVLARLAAVESRPRKLAPDALAALRDYPWPGNVRELRFALERAFFSARGDTIGRADLDLGNPADHRFARLAASLRATHDDAVATFEAIYFRHQLDTHPNKLVAARAAGMTTEGFRLACRRVKVA